jgi:hypothetical protein
MGRIRENTFFRANSELNLSHPLPHRSGTLEMIDEIGSDGQSFVSPNSSVEQEISWSVTLSACDFKIVVQILQLAAFLIHM